MDNTISQREDPFASVRYWNDQRLNKGWWHSFELPDGSRIDGVCSLDGLQGRIAQFPIPADLRGKRVLDIGTWDGWFAFEMERRGAQVVAIDNWDNPRFHEVHGRLGSHVEYRQFEMYDLTPESVGRFDIVLFMGVLYHLKHPLLALERVCALTKDLAAVESFILTPEYWPDAESIEQPVLRFFETDEMGGQSDNWVAPSLACLLAFCRTAGFARVIPERVTQFGAAVTCYRGWLPPASPLRNSPELLEAAHNTNGGINFSASQDDYVSIWFHSVAESLEIDRVQPEVDCYGARPTHVARIAESIWQANFKLPPGLAPGWHEVTVRLQDTAPSNSKTIAVDLPFTPETIRIVGSYDSTTWISGQVDLRQGEFVSLWVEGLPANADRNNVRVYCNRRRLTTAYVAPGDRDQARQVNVQVWPGTSPGVSEIHIDAGESRSQLVEFLVISSG